ncbi:16S rRNA pseudouridine516 synthase [Lachnospiraceae bacterium G11]|nr:16S rRNA pseudouridine516 synthase [Lachnospiraceae bacterium G11]
MLVRLDKWLSEKSSLTRSEAKDALKKGKVLVNGQTAKDPSLKLNTDSDEVILDGNKLIYEKNVYFVLNKPAGFVTSTSDSDGVNVMSLLKGEVTKNLFPVGRLDKDTEGLLLITDDGELAHRLLSPKKHVKKTYYVECQKSISDFDMDILRNGVDIGDDTPTKEAEVTRIDGKIINLSITEGRFHQVKRMLEAVDNKVVYLKRLSFGNLVLEDLGINPGEYRKLNSSEIDILKRS